MKGASAMIISAASSLIIMMGTLVLMLGIILFSVTNTFSPIIMILGDWLCLQLGWESPYMIVVPYDLNSYSSKLLKFHILEGSIPIDLEDRKNCECCPGHSLIFSR